jgi:hypothetical protein
MNATKREVVFAAVDQKYYRKYAAVWAFSVFKNNLHGHLHVIDPSERDLRGLARLSQITNDRIQYTTGDLQLTFPRDKSYFASFRFLYLEQLLGKYQKVIVTDIDSIIRQDLQFPAQDFGFFLRDGFQSEDSWFRDSSRVAAGIFYIDLNEQAVKRFTHAFLSQLNRLNDIGSWRWMVDQNALFTTYNELKQEKKWEIHHFTSEDFSWEFEDSAKIWTGKGDRKRRSKRYLKEFWALRLQMLIKKLLNAIN